MRIPTTPESVDGFIDRLTALMQDDATHLYFDTSFLMWLTAIGPISRAEFFAWAASLGERTHVPLWTMHEYYRHHCAGTLKDRLMRSASELDAASKAFLSKVAPYADRPLMAGQPEAAYREALRIAANRLDNLVALAKDWNYEESAVETLTWMNGRTCAGTTVFDALPGLIANGKGRYTQDVPPGFEDRRKKDRMSRGSNRYGDLLFWQEVMAHAEAGGSKAVLVVSNDRKKDWYFKMADAVVDPQWKRLRSRWEPVPVPHPTLAFELKSKAGIDSLDLLDQLYLGAIVWKTGRPQYERFASVAIDIEAQQPPRASSATIVKPSQKRSENATIGLKDAIDLVKAGLTQPDAAAVTLGDRLEGTAPDAESFVQGFSALDLEPLSQAAVVCFARTIHDRALDGSGPAQALTARLMGMLDKLDADTAACTYLGFALSAYFVDGVPRPRPHSHVMAELFAWQDDTAFSKVLQVLGRHLVSQRSPAIYLPNSQNKRMEVVVTHDARTRQNPVELVQVSFDGKALLTAAEVRPDLLLRTQLRGASECSVGEVVRTLCSFYGVPAELVDVRGGDAGPETGQRKPLAAERIAADDRTMLEYKAPRYGPGSLSSIRRTPRNPAAAAAPSTRRAASAGPVSSAPIAGRSSTRTSTPQRTS
jgi:hypothetical protein